MARMRTFSFAAPARGRAAEACGTDVVNPTLPRSSPDSVTLEALLVAVEDQLHLPSRRVTPRRACMPSRLDAGGAQAVSSITHVTTGCRDVPAPRGGAAIKCTPRESGDRAR